MHRVRVGVLEVLVGAPAPEATSLSEQAEGDATVKSRQELPQKICCDELVVCAGDLLGLFSELEGRHIVLWGCMLEFM